MTQMKALLIEWDTNTGIRAGNINPRDKKLRCNGWQNMDVIPAIELRIIDDDRDTSVYNELNGVTFITGRSEINNTIDEKFKSVMKVEDELIYGEHIISKRDAIDFENLPDNRNARLTVLKNLYNIKGIKEIKHQKV